MYRHTRRYIGPLRGVVLDWSGTIVDPYVLAPTEAFRTLFRRHGVPISSDEARAPMGQRKDLHIAAILNSTRVREAWRQEKGSHPTSNDVERLFEEFVPLQCDIIPNFAQLVPTAATALQQLQEMGLKLGVTTGFSSAMTAALLPAVAAQGFRPDAAIAGDDVAHGNRPRPFMLFRAMELMDVWPVQAVLKVDDTPTGVQEGLAAGCWTAGVARYSNEMGIDSLEEAAKLTPSEISARLSRSREKLAIAGAHFVIDDLSALPSVCSKINASLSEGSVP